jgi:hypothetical protein
MHAMIRGMNDWLALTNALTRTMTDYAPGWTNRNDADPGITILELIAYLAESLQYHRGVVDNGSASALRTIQALDAYDATEAIAVRVDGKQWRRVGTLADAPPDAPVFTLAESTGVIEFGDGVHGRRPPRGSTVFVRYGQRGGDREQTSVAVRTTWPPRRGAYRVALREEGTLQVTPASKLAI